MQYILCYKPWLVHKAKKKKICVFTVHRPTLIFGPDPKLFYGTFSRKFLNALFLPSNVVFDV